ncbi:MAG: NtaA/DmoA family FMN-dependent monooxygenase [Leucobacter sp.]
MTFHAFTQFGWPDGCNGLWRDRAIVPPRELPDLQWWIELARIAERGRFDTLFFADAMGMGGFTPDDIENEISSGRIILWDPAVAIPALAAATEHLGFLFTSSIMQEPPFTFARRASTLDQLTGGRVAWNIVTSYSPGAARNFGLDDLPSREERYAAADEYASVAYQLWEGSWDDDAVVADASTGVYVDPARVRPIHHAGERYRVAGPHLTPPTPQRTPFIVQAGGSPTGRGFAARHAEMQFLATGAPESMRSAIDDVRARAVAAGRGADEIGFTISTGFIVGSTDEEARALADAYDALDDFDDHAGYIAGSLGIDLSGLGPDDRVPSLDEPRSEGGMSGVLAAMRTRLGTGTPTLRELVGAYRDRNRVVGCPERIADAVEGWRELGFTGVALALEPRPQSLVDFVDHVTPVLQRRGLAQREYASGTLRNKIMGYGDRVPASHPAARYRQEVSR